MWTRGVDKMLRVFSHIVSKKSFNYFIHFYFIMITIVYCHPHDNSFNHSILQAVCDQYTQLGRQYDVINLYAEGFNPVLDGACADPHTDAALVARYQKALLDSEQVIFIFPVWWGVMPAMLKGWIDKVFAKGIIYDTTPEGALMPCLSVDKTTLITTSQAPSESFESFFGGYFPQTVLNTVGLNGVNWLNCDQTDTSADHRTRFLDQVLSAVA